MNVQDFKESLNGRDIFIWGTGTYGISVFHQLEKWGIAVSGFVDSIQLRKNFLLNSKILTDSEFFNEKNDAVIIVCTRAFSEKIIKKICEHGVSEKQIINWNELSPCDYYIETNNKCNLRCCTCSISSLSNEKMHNMPNAVFKKVIDKIIKEDPFVSFVNIYGGNEPLLSPDLHEKIAYCKSLGLCVGLSTNLMVNYDYEAFVRSRPDWVRISLSGWGENYEKMHRNGKFSVLLEHMRLLSGLRMHYYPEMSIEVIFHKYKHNKDDIAKIAALCEELKFEFRELCASVIGLDSVANILDGRPIPRKMLHSLPLLLHSVQDTAKAAFEERNSDCVYTKIIKIYSDCSVASCQCWQNSQLDDVDFLDIPLDDLLSRLENGKLCGYCREKGLHRYYLQVFDEQKQ